jgi:hypothetical protein
VYSGKASDSIVHYGYIIARDGADVSRYNTESEERTHLDYATGIGIIGEKGSLLKIIFNKDYDTGFIQRELIGSAKDIQLNEEDLYQQSYFNVWDSSGENRTEENSSDLRNFLQISFVSKAEFLHEQKKAPHLFLQDTASVKKINGIFRLKTAKGDTVIKEAGSNQLSYEGQYPSINQYVISYLDPVAENYGFDFIDKTTGKDTFGFNSFPVLSCKKDLIAELDQNGDQETADLAIYSINRNKIQRLFLVNFTKWFAEEKSFCIYNMFWGRDNCLYLKVYHSKVYSQETGEEQKNYQYIKIQVLKTELKLKDEE